MEPPTAIDEHVEATRPSREPVADQGVDAHEEGLDSKQVVAALRELGPRVGSVAVLSALVPGALGTALIVGLGLSLSVIAQALGLAQLYAPAEAARVLLIAVLCFAPLMAIATGSMLLPTYAMSFFAGALFGMWGGGAAAMFGVTFGGLIGYGWGVLLVRGKVMEVIESHEKARIVRRAIVDRSLLQETMVVGLIRLPANSPFALTNLFMSSLGVRMIPFLAGTFLGILPRTLFAVWLGAQAESLVSAQDRDRTTQIILMIVGIAIFIGVYQLLKKWAKDALLAEAGTSSA